MSCALLFPGQGSQTVGMRAAFHGAGSPVDAVFDEAASVLGDDFVKLLDEGPAEQLALTYNAQPAILTVSVAAFEAMRDRLDEPVLCAAGHSLGEFSALVVAKAMDFSDALKAVRLRGEAMQKAVPVGQGAMAAVIGMDPAALTHAVSSLSTEEHPLGVAAFNTPDQATITGTADAVERAAQELKAQGARRVVPLAVSAPFHSVLMQPAVEPLRRCLASIEIRKPAFDVLSNVTVQPHPGGDESREWLLRQLTQPVRFLECAQQMVHRKPTHIYELGAGSTLAGMLRKIDRDTSVIGVAGTVNLAAA